MPTLLNDNNQVVLVGTSKAANRMPMLKRMYVCLELHFQVSFHIIEIEKVRKLFVIIRGFNKFY